MKPVRITINGKPHSEVELTREVALSLMSEERRSAVPDGWIPDPNRLTLAHLISTLRRAVMLGVTGDADAFTFRMRREAALQVEEFMTLIKDGLAFRGYRVVIDESVPWVDLDIRTPEGDS